MNSLQRNAIVLKLIALMREQRSWCGETHIQKAVFLLNDLAGIPTDLEFVLYKHGPFSFELRDELTAMRADEMLELRVQPQPYGPKLIPTSQAEAIEKKFPKTLERYNSQLVFVADTVSDKGVSDLEKLATAVFVLNRECMDGSPEEQARRLHEIKPHIPLQSAFEAIMEARNLKRSAQDYGFTV